MERGGWPGAGGHGGHGEGPGGDRTGGCFGMFLGV